MFLLVSVRHVGAHPDELQHGVSIQSSVNLGKTFPRISRIRIIPSTQILARIFVYLPPFISKILDFINFYFDLFLNGVTLKTSNKLISVKKYKYKLTSRSVFPFRCCFAGSPQFSSSIVKYIEKTIPIQILR